MGLIGNHRRGKRNQITKGKVAIIDAVMDSFFHFPCLYLGRYDCHKFTLSNYGH